MIKKRKSLIVSDPLLVNFVAKNPEKLIIVIIIKNEDFIMLTWAIIMNNMKLKIGNNDNELLKDI